MKIGELLEKHDPSIKEQLEKALADFPADVRSVIYTNQGGGFLGEVFNLEIKTLSYSIIWGKSEGLQDLIAKKDKFLNKIQNANSQVLRAFIAGLDVLLASNNQERMKNFIEELLPSIVFGGSWGANAAFKELETLKQHAQMLYLLQQRVEKMEQQLKELGPAMKVMKEITNEMGTLIAQLNQPSLTRDEYNRLSNHFETVLLPTYTQNFMLLFQMQQDASQYEVELKKVKELENIVKEFKQAAEQANEVVTQAQNQLNILGRLLVAKNNSIKEEKKSDMAANVKSPASPIKAETKSDEVIKPNSPIKEESKSDQTIKPKSPGLKLDDIEDIRITPIDPPILVRPQGPLPPIPIPARRPSHSSSSNRSNSSISGMDSDHKITPSSRRSSTSSGIFSPAASPQKSMVEELKSDVMRQINLCFQDIADLKSNQSNSLVNVVTRLVEDLARFKAFITLEIKDTPQDFQALAIHGALILDSLLSAQRETYKLLGQANQPSQEDLALARSLEEMIKRYEPFANDLTQLNEALSAKSPSIEKKDDLEKKEPEQKSPGKSL